MILHLGRRSRNERIRRFGGLEIDVILEEESTLLCLHHSWAFFLLFFFSSSVVAWGFVVPQWL